MENTVHMGSRVQGILAGSRGPDRARQEEEVFDPEKENGDPQSIGGTHFPLNFLMDVFGGGSGLAS